MDKIETPKEFAKRYWLESAHSEESMLGQLARMVGERDAAILHEVADAGEAELFELTRPYREQMATCQAENDLQGYDHAYRVVQDMGNGGHAYVRAIRKLLKESTALEAVEKERDE